MRRRGPRSHGLRGPKRPAVQAAAPVATPRAVSAAEAGAARETRREEQLKAGTSHSHEQNSTQRAANSVSSGRGSPAPLPPKPARGRKPRPGSQLPPQVRRLRPKPQQRPPTSGPASTFPGLLGVRTPQHAGNASSPKAPKSSFFFLRQNRTWRAEGVRCRGFC